MSSKNREVKREKFTEEEKSKERSTNKTFNQKFWI